MNAEIIEKMKTMKFYGMLRAFRSNLESGAMNNLTTDEMVAHLIEEEWDDRYNRKIARILLNAKFRYKASIEQMYFEAERGMDKNLVMRLADGSFIENKENILITGSTGIGKSYLASALGQQACTLGYRVMYLNASKLFAKLKMAKADNSYITEIAKMERQQLIILDDFGIQPLDAQSRSMFMEIIEDRHGKASTLITSQVPVSKWYEVIGEVTIADAIMDRLIHNAHRIELKGESLRKTLKNKTDNQSEINN
ncbi:MAG: ATP-binding protein [Bacteroidetes bacterium]|nr:ATP-binding protein [Bacteroidota bacterium]